jgi:ubiquinone/menaquinone biosynthesis C-methylase UbiE
MNRHAGAAPAESQGVDHRMRDAYDRIAPGFAVRNAGMPAEFRDVLGPRFLEQARRAAAAAGAPAPAVLDVGCGAGRDAAWLASGGAAVTGADLSRGMLAQALARLREGGSAQAPPRPPRLVQMDMRRLGFAHGRFAGAWCSASLLHLPKTDAPAALGEIRRVLVRGGVLFLALQEGEGERWEPLDANAYGHPVERFFARYGAEAAEALLGGSGFGVALRHHGPVGSRRWLRFLAVA